MDAQERKPGRSRKTIIWIGLSLIMTVVVVLSVISSWEVSVGPGSKKAAKERPGDYGRLIAEWNHWAREWSRAYEIKGDYAASAESVIKTLGNWAAAYGAPLPPEMEAELGLLSQEVPGSAFHEYARFRQQYYTPEPPALSPKLSERELAAALNRLAGVEGETITAQTVQTTIYLNDFCGFFWGEKERLHEKGWHTRAESCDRAGTGGRYPALDTLIQPESPFYRR